MPWALRRLTPSRDAAAQFLATPSHGVIARGDNRDSPDPAALAFFSGCETGDVMDINQLPDLSGWIHVEVWTLEEAAMLWAAIDPMEHAGKRLEELKPNLCPAQYKKALLFMRATKEAVCAGTLSFTDAFEEDYDDMNGYWMRKVSFPDLPDPTLVVAHKTRVKQAVFMLWAKSKNIPSYRQSLTQSKTLQLPTTVQGEHNPTQPAPLLLPLPAFLDTSHPCHSAELRAGAEVWDAVVSTGAHEKAKSVKEAILGALDTHPEYKQFSTEAKKRLSTVVNWNKEGGATKTPTKAKPPTPKE